MPIVIASGVQIEWVTSIIYLGGYLESSIKCKFQKSALYKVFNVILGGFVIDSSGRSASQEEVLFALIKS